MDAVFELFEGSCPRCHEDVTIVEVSGTPQFLDEQRFEGEYRTQTWECANGASENGVVRFECPNGHKHEAYHFTDGDWAA